MSTTEEKKEELSSLIENCKLFLSEAAINPDHPWRLGVLANVDIAGNPECRYIILRDAQFENELGELSFFTDQRSKKIFSLRRQPQISLCFFDPLARLQLSVKATVSLYNQDIVCKNYWDSTSWHSLQCFYMQETPGEELVAPFMLKSEELSEDEAYRYFTVVKCKILSWDILRLTDKGNQRAFCLFDDQGNVKASHWMAP